MDLNTAFVVSKLCDFSQFFFFNFLIKHIPKCGASSIFNKWQLSFYCFNKSVLNIPSLDPAFIMDNKKIQIRTVRPTDVVEDCLTLEGNASYRDFFVHFMKRNYKFTLKEIPFY